MMYFDSFSSLVHMDGHGIYVWSTYGIGMAVIAYNVIAPLLSRKKLLRRLSRQTVA
ncbi:heme exporter protein CcmD [Endozoicomonas lisbonensis]|uniref:Heme exporter protein D n=1 Tax=Endozoicomonas lisbonensis TaxID=3120522 RepID=A0ABV2SNT2_9GAMM